jgi:hypothetical protein
VLEKKSLQDQIIIDKLLGEIETTKKQISDETAEKGVIIAELHATIAELRDELDGTKKKSSDENSETTNYGLQDDLAGKKKPKKRSKAKGAATEAETAD